MQQIDFIKSFPATRWALLFITAHLFCWTLLPILIRYNLPLDAIEGTLWGHQLEWGYDKNPFLNGWLTALAIHLDGRTGWMVYLFSQLSVAICFISIWQLAKHLLPPVLALASIMLLEGVQYYTFHAIDFNDNTLELGLWGLTIYFFYLALRNASKRAWIFTGVFAALGMMAKYYTAALLTAMVLFLFIYKNNRQQLKSLSPYLSLLIFLILLLPHVIWLFFHDFITVTYVFQRAASAPSWTNHFFFPAQFAWQQGQAFLPALLLFAFLFIGRKPFRIAPPLAISTFDKQFLFFMGLGPFLLTVLLSLLLGIKLRAGWGMPLLSLWGVLLIAWVQPAVTKPKLIRFIIAVFTMMSLLLAGYALSLVYSSTPSSANFPGREIANKITQQWHDTYHTKLEYVAGSRWIGGNIEFYSPDQPAVFVEWDTRKAPWINLHDLQKKGAVFVWEMSNDESMPDSVKSLFAPLPAKELIFYWHRNKNIAPIKIGVAVLPPRGCNSRLSWLGIFFIRRRIKKLFLTKKPRG